MVDPFCYLGPTPLNGPTSRSQLLVGDGFIPDKIVQTHAGFEPATLLWLKLLRWQ